MNAGDEACAPGDSAVLRKAVILARGLGKRMREWDAETVLNSDQSALADAGIKALLPVGRPFLDHVLSALADAGYEQVCLVIGPEHRAVREYYTVTTPPRRIRVSFAIQARPLGTADAVLAAEEFVADREFLVMNSDNYCPPSVLLALRTLGEPGAVLFEREALIRKGNIPEGRVKSYAICRIDSDDYLEDIIEKPDEATLRSWGKDAFISMNIWRFTSAIFEACRRVPLSPREELELPVAVREAIRTRRMRFRVLRCYEGVLDLSRRADIAAVTEKLRGIQADP